MYFQQFVNGQHGCASYLIASRRTHEAAIVDPGIDLEPYEGVLRERSYRLRFVIDTHIHADHLSGARRLASRHDATLCLHHAAATSYPYHPLHDGDELELGQLRLRIWHTPGHRPELISIQVADLERCHEPPLVLTGDSLLVGDVGRPDFAGGDAEAQYQSITRLLGLPDWVEVFPGHFEGPCGNDMWGRASTTIGFERLFNPLAQLDREDFVTVLSSSVPARPLNMCAIEATNRGTEDVTWAMLTTAPYVQEVSVQELATRLENGDDRSPPGSPGILVIDVREPEEYARGHVPGAINLAQAELASHLDEVPRDRQVFVICQTGVRSRRSAQFLQQVGISGAVNVSGGTLAWMRAKHPVEKSESIT
jgi:glyoxylase-like metal-dependent hydrolase (beta-lactamase superfamily II)/rhodanese-related sulfurtransferase